MSGSFTKISRANFHGFTAPFFYVLILMTVLAVFLSRPSPVATRTRSASTREVSRLAGVRVKAVQTGALVCSGTIAAIAGIVLTARLSSATPSSGNPYLLPAFAATYLGATQFKAKRFNAVGSVIAVYMLGTGQYGLLLASAPQWMPNVFQGVALVAAIGLTQLQDPTRAAIRKRQRAARPPRRRGGRNRRVRRLRRGPARSRRRVRSSPDERASPRASEPSGTVFGSRVHRRRDWTRARWATVHQ